MRRIRKGLGESSPYTREKTPHPPCGYNAPRGKIRAEYAKLFLMREEREERGERGEGGAGLEADAARTGGKMTFAKGHFTASLFMYGKDPGNVGLFHEAASIFFSAGSARQCGREPG
ncbi:MAG: hypothetical protein K2M45_08255 [Muribaculaceae bacterium]|nr:hypothetical protein [Muribaculaceae bacterium]